MKSPENRLPENVDLARKAVPLFLRLNGKNIRRIWQTRTEAHVRTSAVVVLDPFSQKPSKILFVKRDNVVEALSSNRPINAFTDSVGSW